MGDVPRDPEALPRQLLRINVAQQLSEMGFGAVRESALDVLTDMTMRCKFFRLFLSLTCRHRPAGPQIPQIRGTSSQN